MRARLPYAPPVFRTHRPPFGPVHSGPARSICYDPSESVLFAPPMMPLPRPGASHSFRPSFFSGHGPHARARRHPPGAAPNDSLHLASNGVRRSAAGAGRHFRRTAPPGKTSIHMPFSTIFRNFRTDRLALDNHFSTFAPDFRIRECERCFNLKIGT